MKKKIKKITNFTSMGSHALWTIHLIKVKIILIYLEDNNEFFKYDRMLHIFAFIQNHDLFVNHLKFRRC